VLQPGLSLLLVVLLKNTFICGSIPHVCSVWPIAYYFLNLSMGLE
jgi:hypothetical protein